MYHNEYLLNSHGTYIRYYMNNLRYNYASSNQSYFILFLLRLVAFYIQEYSSWFDLILYCKFGLFFLELVCYTRNSLAKACGTL